MKVAVIENDLALLSVVCEILEEQGHTPVPFGHVDAATGPLIAQAHPDVLITDIDVPGDGFNVADELRKRSHPPIVLITSMDEPPDLQAHGAVAVLHKPFTIVELIQTISDVASNKWRSPLRLQR